MRVPRGRRHALNAHYRTLIVGNDLVGTVVGNRAGRQDLLRTLSLLTNLMSIDGNNLARSLEGGVSRKLSYKLSRLLACVEYLNLGIFLGCSHCPIIVHDYHTWLLLLLNLLYLARLLVDEAWNDLCALNLLLWDELLLERRRGELLLVLGRALHVDDLLAIRRRVYHLHHLLLDLLLLLLLLVTLHVVVNCGLVVNYLHFLFLPFSFNFLLLYLSRLRIELNALEVCGLLSVARVQVLGSHLWLLRLVEGLWR